MKNKLQTKNMGYAVPAKAKGQNFSGDTYIDM